MLADLTQHFPAERVVEALRYADTTLGFEGLCRGQVMDLYVSNKNTTLADILEMYRLKTSIALEGPLVLLMIMAGRNQQEIDQIKQYAHHAGIVFQIRDDILDITAQAKHVGKDTQNDNNKVNVVRQYGLETAERIMHERLVAANTALQGLPFNTSQLRGILQYFASRRK